MVSPLARGLLIAGAAVCGAGLGVELAYHLGPLSDASRVYSALSLSFEANLPTWYTACLLWTAALGLGLCGLRATEDRGRWWLLAGLFALASLDEAIELHEELGGAPLHGVLYFSWVVWGALLVFAFVLGHWRFWRRLPPPTRRGFAWAAVVYVGGALGMELPLGAWFELHGDDNLGYALLDAVEETMEIAGVSLFLLAIAAHLERESTEAQPAASPGSRSMAVAR